MCPYVSLATKMFSCEIFIFLNISIIVIRFTAAVAVLAVVHTTCLFVYWQHYVADTKFYNTEQENLKRDYFNLNNNITKKYNRKLYCGHYI